MKYISLYQPPTKEFIAFAGRKRGMPEDIIENFDPPKEDHLLAEKSKNVFVVADGVTLNIKKLVKEGREYPDPSPAGEVARIFCESVVDEVSRRYASFGRDDIGEVFQAANQRVWEYNKKKGKSDITGNRTGHFAATGAFVVVKDRKMYWMSICDSFFAHFDKAMNRKFISEGECEPYAVINGEERMTEHIQSGVREFEAGDRVFVHTDGFENYITHPDFQEVFQKWKGDLKTQIKSLSRRLNKEDPDKYGHERTLVALSL